MDRTLPEQLELALVKPKSRQYSASLLASASMWQIASPALYKQFLSKRILSQSSLTTIKRLSFNLLLNVGLPVATKTYLKVRINNLNLFQRKAILIADEIYTAQKVEFGGGKLFGTDSGVASKTLLCYMVKLLTSQQLDVVYLTPIVNLTAEAMHHDFVKVLECVKDVGFEIVAISIDNSMPNKKFAQKILCNGVVL
ncbi:hypothetical protein TCAL_17149 [Tigriopus californicus]|uniref:Transposable element P transposase n=1 Tax=Tigriopus californicus TaxID=6832 RepID=A0A553P2N0_TIGCA|nr:hypothetical protein TCAL_17149 [Tigriopus californicus]